MNAAHILLALSLVWAVTGFPAPKEEANELDDEDAALAELARKLRPLESLESKQRRLEELESRQRLRNSLESSHRSLDTVEPHGCSGGCASGMARSKVNDLEAEYVRDLKPRPIFGLLNEILETARYGYKVDRPRPHLIF